MIEDGRIEGVDSIRMVAALGATWLHTCESPELAWTGEFGRFAVPVFNTIAAYFLVRSIRRNPGRSYAEYASTRFDKLYIPFLAWSLIYIIARMVKSWAFGTERKPLAVGVLLEGPSHQLWYLPFVLICGLIGFPLAIWALKSRNRRWLVAGICIGVAMVLSLLRQPDWTFLKGVGLDYLANRVFARSPSFLLGYAVAMLVGHSTSAWDVVQVSQGGRRKVAAALALLAGMACVVLGVFVKEITLPGLAHVWPVQSLFYTLAGLLLVASAFGDWQNACTSFLSRMRFYAFGVFLSHTLFIEGLQAVAGLSFHLDNKWTTDLVIFVMTIGLSIGLTALLRSSRSTRWLIPS